MGIELGPGRLFIKPIGADNADYTPFGAGGITELDCVQEDTEPEVWPAINPFLQLQQEATLTCKAFIDLRELMRLTYGRKRWRNKCKAVYMLNLKRRRREALLKKIRRNNHDQER